MCTLPPKFPANERSVIVNRLYFTFCAPTLELQVSLEFCSFPASHTHPDVPAGLPYYTLQAQLSGGRLPWLLRS